MTIADYLRLSIPGPITEAILADVHPNNDDPDETLGSILAEMPADSNCGIECMSAVASIVPVIVHIRNGFGHDMDDDLVYPVIYAAVRVCCVYIRG